MNNKTLIIGKTGSGKSYEAIREAILHKGTTIIVNGCAKKEYYQDKFPEIQEFEEFNNKIEDNKKYFIYQESPETYKKIDFLEKFIYGKKYEKLKKDDGALIIFDDGAWNSCIRHEDRIEKLIQLHKADCGIIIVEQSLYTLVGLNEKALEKSMEWELRECIHEVKNIYEINKKTISIENTNPLLMRIV